MMQRSIASTCMVIFTFGLINIWTSKEKQANSNTVSSFQTNSLLCLVDDGRYMGDKDEDGKAQGYAVTFEGYWHNEGTYYNGEKHGIGELFCLKFINVCSVWVYLVW